MTRGTDPHIFLVRALLGAGLTEKDITPVLLQHADGKTALIRGDVDAWAGLDPMMAQAEIEEGAKLFYRKADANTWGILNVREAFLKDHPDIVRRVLATYEDARKYALANYDELKKTFIAVTKLPDAVVDRQLKERTELTHSRIGAPQRDSILAAGLALQQAGVVDAKVDVKAALDSLIDDQVPLPVNCRPSLAQLRRPGMRAQCLPSRTSSGVLEVDAVGLWSELRQDRRRGFASWPPCNPLRDTFLLWP